MSNYEHNLLTLSRTYIKSNKLIIRNNKHTEETKKKRNPFI